MKAVKKWSEAMSDPQSVESLVLDVKQLPRVRFPAAKPMPPEIAKLVNLRQLRIRARNLEGLCPELASLQHLESLDIDNTEFTEFAFGDVLERLPALRTLELYNMGLKGPIALPPTLQSLTLEDEHGLELDAWLESLQQLPELRSLSLVDVGLSEVPASLTRLTSLQTLSLTGNALSDLSMESAAFGALETLILVNNEFATLPNVLRSLPRLEVLLVDHNPLSEVPDWIGELKGLRQLGLSVTALEDLPPSLLSLPLERLSLDVPEPVLAHVRTKLPKCKVVSRNAGDVEREVQRWLRFMGKA